MTATLTEPTTATDPTPEPCASACATLLAVRGEHAAGCTRYVNLHPKAWCATCRRRVQIEDVSVEGHMERHGEVGYRVEYLTCGHTTQGPSVVVAPAPGAPYAGIKAAPSARLRKLGDFIGPDPFLDPA